MSEPYEPAHIVDARDLACPMPIVKTRKAVDAVQPGQRDSTVPAEFRKGGGPIAYHGNAWLDYPR